eukprot:s4907_g5.t1
MAWPLDLSPISSIQACCGHFGVLPELWKAFVRAAGDPGDDARLLAALPPSAVAATAEATVMESGEPISMIQEAVQIGLVYRLARRKMHVDAGLELKLWPDPNLWDQESQDATPQSTVDTVTGTKAGERKMKFTAVLDQGDETEFVVQPESQKQVWLQVFIDLTGNVPLEQEEPSVEQISALQRRLSLGQTSPRSEDSLLVQHPNRLLLEGISRTWQLRAVEGLFPSMQNCSSNVESNIDVNCCELRRLHRAPGQNICGVLASSGASRRPGSVRAPAATQGADRHGDRPGREGTGTMVGRKPVGMPVPEAHQGQRVLGPPSAYPSQCLAVPWVQREVADPSRSCGRDKHAGRQKPQKGGINLRHGELHLHEGRTTESGRDSMRIRVKKGRPKARGRAKTNPVVSHGTATMGPVLVSRQDPLAKEKCKENIDALYPDLQDILLISAHKRKVDRGP